MYTLPRSNYLRRSLYTSHRSIDPVLTVDYPSHEVRIKKELRDLGVSRYGMLKFESRYLPHIIHPNEKIGGVVYGYRDEGSAMLVATDRRIIFLDKKPMFVNEEEITYEVVSGVSFSHAGIGSTVILHTRIKDFTIRTYNRKSALNFVEYIESRCLDTLISEGRDDRIA